MYQTYQSAHDDLAGSSRDSLGGWVSSLGGSLGRLRLLHASNGGLDGGATVVAAAASLTTATDEVVERLIQVGRHSEDLLMTGWQSWQFAIRDKSRYERVDGWAVTEERRRSEV